MVRKPTSRRRKVRVEVEDAGSEGNEASLNNEGTDRCWDYGRWIIEAGKLKLGHHLTL